MVAPLIAAAGLSAIGSVVGGITGGKGAKKAAKAQAASTAAQIAAAERNRDYIAGLEQPTITRGNQAGDLYGGFVGLGGADAAKEALSNFRGSTGYEDLLKTGLGAVNANAYAKGAGQSGAAYKALQDRGVQIADRSSSDWLGRLGTLMNMGQAGIGNVAGVATHATDTSNAARQTSADASGNAALISGSAWQKALQGLFNAGGSALGSSYGGGGSSGVGIYG